MPDLALDFLPTDRLVPALGFDAGLRHGALIQSVFHFSDSRNWVRLVKWQTCFKWGPESKYAIGEKSPLSEVEKLAEVLIGAVPPGPAPLAIDYDPMSVSWNSRKLQMMQLAYFVGYLTRGIQGSGHPTFTIEPSHVRSVFKLPPQAKKAQVWAAFLDRVRVDREHAGLFRNKYGDIADAVVLGYLAAVATKTVESRHNQTPFIQLTPPDAL